MLLLIKCLIQKKSLLPFTNATKAFVGHQDEIRAETIKRPQKLNCTECTLKSLAI